MTKGPLLILSGPSGTGKSTVIQRLLDRGDLRLRLSVSATTRARRSNEEPGKHYHYWTRPQFEAAIQAKEFLEWAEVYGHYYGTLRAEVEPYRERGVGVILDIDTVGADQVRRQAPDHVSVFLKAPSLNIYGQRLRQRRTETEEALQRRLAAAQRELDRAGEYDFVIVNDELDQAVAAVHDILKGLFERGSHAG